MLGVDFPGKLECGEEGMDREKFQELFMAKIKGKVYVRLVRPAIL